MDDRGPKVVAEPKGLSKGVAIVREYVSDRASGARDRREPLSGVGSYSVDPFLEWLGPKGIGQTRISASTASPSRWRPHGSGARGYSIVTTGKCRISGYFVRC